MELILSKYGGIALFPHKKSYRFPCFFFSFFCLTEFSKFKIEAHGGEFHAAVPDFFGFDVNIPILL